SIAIGTERTGKKSIVSGVVHRRVEIAIQPKDVELLVIFVLVDSFERNLHHRVHHFRDPVTDWESQVVSHGLSLFSKSAASCQPVLRPGEAALHGLLL